MLILGIAWISWLNLSVLIGTLALALYNASEDNEVARMFAYAYAIISIGVLVSARFFLPLGHLALIFKYSICVVRIPPSILIALSIPLSFFHSTNPIPSHFPE